MLETVPREKDRIRLEGVPVSLPVNHFWNNMFIYEQSLIGQEKNQRSHAMEKSWIWVNTLFLTCETESTPRQVDKKSKGPQGGDTGLGLSRRRQMSGILEEEERTNVFFSVHSLVLVT